MNWERMLKCTPRRMPPILLLAICLTQNAFAKEILVTPPPPDADALGVLEAALAEAGPGDRVILEGGEYRLSEALRFPKSGRPDASIILAAAPESYVALLGSVRLTGWQKHEGPIWRVKRPEHMVKGLYEDAVRLSQPRVEGKRENPPVAELRGPGMWTQDAEWIYLWSREGDSPDNHRIEASQNGVVDMNQPWIRVEGLRMFFGQHTVCQISADHCEVIGCEIAHCSNSVDNSYAAYFTGCSNSAFRRCLIYDSYYWGDHGSNSHLVSTINCGDDGPNFVDRCTIFNGGLGVGTKGAAREVVVTGCRMFDMVNGVMLAGERSAGPGAGKGDRGHYVVYRNWISHAEKGIWAYGGVNRNNRVWNNLITECAAGVRMRNYVAEPKDLQLVNNIILNCDVGVLVTGGRKGEPSLKKFFDAGLTAHHNLYWGNKAAWRNPLTWSKDLDMSISDLRDQYPRLGRESIVAEPELDRFARSLPGASGLAAGARLDLPAYLERPDAWHIGLGSADEEERPHHVGLTLSIAAPASVEPGETIKLEAALVNESSNPFTVAGSRDAIITYRFGYFGWHFDKQEIHRVRVQLPAATLEPGESLDLTQLEGWQNPVNDALGDPFHLRDDAGHYQRGCRLKATLRIVDRQAKTAEVLHHLAPEIWSRQVLPIAYR